MTTAATTESVTTKAQTMIIVTTTGAHPHTVDTRIADAMTIVTRRISMMSVIITTKIATTTVWAVAIITTIQAHLYVMGTRVPHTATMVTERVTMMPEIMGTVATGVIRKCTILTRTITGTIITTNTPIIKL